jgi:type II secretion system protein D
VRTGTDLGGLAPGDQLITQVVPLENLSAGDIAGQVQVLLSPNAVIMPTSTNSLIITDTAANIQRALTLIQNSESELAGGPRVFRLQYYDATEMADLVTTIVLSRGGGAGAIGGRPTWERRVAGRVAAQPRPGQRPQPGVPQPAVAAMGAGGPEFAYPDTRTNSLIVLATPIHLTQIEDIVFQLDRPVSLRGSYFVYPVQNLVASQLADSIAPLIGAQVTRTGLGEEAAAGRTTGSLAGQRQRTDERQQSYSRPLGTQGTGRTSRPSLRPEQETAADGLRLEPLSAHSSAARSADPFMIAQAPEAAAPGAPPPAEPGPAAEPPPGEEYPAIPSVTGAAAESVIVADDNTNTLLISAPPEQIDLVQQMIETLDVLPPQVHIRAIIAEVTLSRDTSLGFQWESLGRTWGVFDRDVFTGDVGTNLGVSGVVRSNTGAVTSRPGGFFATLSGTEFSAVINALTSDSRARILSAPSIFTSNNVQATIDISQQIPIPTGTFQSTTGVGTISTSIGYRSVGIVLSVTPRVTQGDIVQMDVSLSADEPGAEVVVADLAYPSINQRLAETRGISVRNGYTVVLGGLMRESITHTASRVPLLGDLPLIGPLFSSTKWGKSKSELLLFLTPFVVRNPAEMADLSERERDRLWEVPKNLRGPLSGPGAGEQLRSLEPPAYQQPPAGGQEQEMPPAPQEELTEPQAPPAGATEGEPPAAPAPSPPAPAAQAPEAQQQPATPAPSPQPAPPEQPAPAPPQTQPPPPELTPPAEEAGIPAH